MFIKNTEELYSILKTWWDLGEKLGKCKDKYHEQDTLKYMIENGTYFDKDFVKIFPVNSFNSEYGNIKEGDFIAHYMALSTEDKYKNMKRDYERQVNIDNNK